MKVTWRERALDQFADRNVAADPPPRDRAAMPVHAALADDPVHGESRAKATKRSWYVEPVSIVFGMFPSEGLVFVRHFAMRRR